MLICAAVGAAPAEAPDRHIQHPNRPFRKGTPRSNSTGRQRRWPSRPKYRPSTIHQEAGTNSWSTAILHTQLRRLRTNPVNHYHTRTLGANRQTGPRYEHCYFHSLHSHVRRKRTIPSAASATAEGHSAGCPTEGPRRRILRQPLGHGEKRDLRQHQHRCKHGKQQLHREHQSGDDRRNIDRSYRQCLHTGDCRRDQHHLRKQGIHRLQSPERE